MRLMLPLIFVAAEAFCGGEAAVACDRLYTDGRTAWITSGTGERREVLTDPRGVALPRFSPDGSWIVYGNTTARNDEGTMTLVVHASSGSTRKELIVGDVASNAIIGLGWRGNDRVWVEGHVSPVTSIYYEMDVGTGEVRASVRACGVAVSPDGRHVVSTDAAPQTDPRMRASVLLVDGMVVYPPAGDRALHDIEPAIWAPDGSRFAFIETLGNAERRRLMIASADGRAVKEIETPTSPSEAHWLPDGDLLVVSSGAYHILDAADGSARSIDADTVKRWLYVTEDGKSFPVEDRRCRL